MKQTLFRLKQQKLFGRSMSTMRACVVNKQGITATELTVTKDAVVPSVGSSGILVKNTYAGVNFIDTYHRSGLYKKEVPFILGTEGVGIVESVGDGVDTSVLGIERKDLIGKRIAYIGAGGYAEYNNVNLSMTALIPDGVSDEVACAAIIQGVTAQAFTHSATTLDSTKTVLVQAAAGGTGQNMCQMAKALGAKVIGTCSTGKVGFAAKFCDHVIDYTKLDVAEEVAKLTNGAGVDVVYDGVGKTTSEGSLKSAGNRGLVVFFGNSSGPVPPIDLLKVPPKSLYITRASCFNYLVKPGEFQERIKSVFDYIKSGKVTVNVDKIFKLEEASDAHQYLENGESRGKVLLKI